MKSVTGSEGGLTAGGPVPAGTVLAGTGAVPERNPSPSVRSGTIPDAAGKRAVRSRTAREGTRQAAVRTAAVPVRTGGIPAAS